jgi:hypothetical protein
MGSGGIGLVKTDERIFILLFEKNKMSSKSRTWRKMLLSIPGSCLP